MYRQDPQFGDHRYDLSAQEIRIVDMPITGTRHLLLFRTRDGEGSVSIYLSPAQLRALKRRLRSHSEIALAARAHRMTLATPNWGGDPA